MRDRHLYERAQELYESGVPFGDIWRQLGLPKGTVAHWFYGERARQMKERRALAGPSRCPRCDSAANPLPAWQYAYLLGQYLGDGHLVTKAKVPVLRIYCTSAYPGIIAECKAATLAVLARSVSVVELTGCVAVQSYSKHWPCLFPQAGPGRKHHRAIVLEPWQQEIAAAEPRALLRGLIHSDGCRVINRVTVGGKTYAYPRYHFSNESADIMRICADALDMINVEWRFNRANSISIARRDSVAALDAFIGSKC